MIHASAHRAAWLLLFAAQSALATTSPTLIEELERLRAEGLNLVYSSRLVTPDLTATPVEQTLSPAQQAAALLQPHPLALREGGENTWYIVRAWKDQPSNAPSSDELQPIIEEIIVRSRRRLVRSWSQQHRMDGHALDGISVPGGDVLRAVNQLPGNAHSGVSAKQFPRGGNSDESLYLIDGAELIEPFHLNDFEALFSAINPSIVRAVNVYQAGFPVRYGTRLSSVVDMELNDATDRLSGEVDLNPITASAFAQKQSDNLGWLVSARRSTLDLIDSRVKDEYGTPSFRDELYRTYWQGSGHEISLTALRSHDNITLENSSLEEEARSNSAISSYWLSGHHPIGDGNLSWTLGHNSIKTDRRGEIDVEADAIGELRDKGRHAVSNLRFDFDGFSFRSWALQFGLEAQRQRADFDFSIDTQYGILGAALQSTPGVNEQRRARRDGHRYGAYLAGNRDFGERWHIEIGARYDTQDMSPVSNNQFSPRMQVNYTHSDRWAYYLSMGRYAQHQNLYELQLDDGLTELAKPQIADFLGVGVTFNPSPTLELRLDTYYRDTEDARTRFENIYNRWVLLPELHADRLRIAPTAARAYGMDVALRYAPIDQLNINLSASVANTEERVGSHWLKRPWNQRFAYRASIDWESHAWRLSALAHYHTGWPTTHRHTGAPNNVDLYNTKLPNYFSLNLHVSRRWRFGGSELLAYLDLSNATLRENIGGYTYAEDGGVFTRDERKLLPTIPTLGIRYSW